MNKLITRTLLANTGIILGVVLLIVIMFCHYHRYGMHYVITQN
jgi:hypothetical protein